VKNPLTLEWITLTDYPENPNRLDVVCSGQTQDINVQDSVKNTVLDICQNFPAPYNIMCTGGVDSQCVLYAWKKYATEQALSQTKIHSFLYNEQSNMFDMAGLPELCSMHGFEHRFWDFNLLEFVDSGDCLALQKKYLTYSPQMPAHIKMMSSFSHGTQIMSGNLVTSPYLLGMGAEHYSLIRYAKEINSQSSNKKVIPFFFLHDHQIARAASHSNNLILPAKIINLAEQKFNYINRHSAIKCAALMLHGFPVIPQEFNYSGFEQFKDVYEKYHSATPKEKLMASRCILDMDKVSHRVFDIHHRYLVSTKFIRPKGINIINN
jgi:hypothetical protein